MAVLNYQRARLLDPVDPDIRANLDYVRSAAGLPPQPRTWTERIAALASPSVLAWAGLAGLLLAAACTLGARVYRNRRGLLAVGAAAGLIFIGIAASGAAALWPLLNGAVVIAKSAAVRVSPAEMAEPLFNLPEAEQVTVSAEHEGFVLIRTRNGRQGWAWRADIAPIVPKH
jgi:hypothetical protein